jgi:hypothetical protein
MNPYYPRYVDHNQAPPPVMTFAPKYGPKVKPESRNWVCTECGTADRSCFVFIDKWDFSTNRHCRNCKTRTEHRIG